MAALQAEIHEKFEWVRREARRVGHHDAVRWLEFKEADALALEEEPLPQMPKDLASRIR